MLTIPKNDSKPGVFVFSFPEFFELCVCSVVWSVFDVVHLVVELFLISFTIGCVLSTESCTVPVVVVFPVIAKGENPGVCAVKYWYLSSSPDK